MIPKSVANYVKKQAEHYRKLAKAAWANDATGRSAFTFQEDKSMNIIELAYSKPKPSKAGAAAIVTDLAQQHPELVAGLAPLYRYFAPQTTTAAATKRATDEPWEWLKLALAKEGCTRPAYEYIFRDGTQAVATDGVRMHIWHKCAAAEVAGSYTPEERQLLTTAPAFPPHWREVAGKTYGTTLGRLTVKPAAIASGSVEADVLEDGKRIGVVNYKFWEHLVIGFPQDAAVYLDWKNYRGQQYITKITLTTDERTAILSAIDPFYLQRTTGD